MTNEAHHCNDAVLYLLQEKLLDIEKVADHATQDISHICVEKELLEQIRNESRRQIGLLTDALEANAAKNPSSK
ncbi:MAG: hypothetical protein KC653_02785 [Candidatus Andersenbacteria bacterium]|nr:hypothetical protein [Candidatus Andersenbacteria bacterium]